MLEHATRKFHETLPRNGLGKLAHDAHGTLAFLHEPFELLEAERSGDQHVVADFHVAVERQVVAVQRDSMLHQAAHALSELPHQYAVLAVPEAVRVMDEDAVGLLLDGGVYQAVAERHPRHDAGHLIGGLHAETVIAVVLEGLRFEQVVEPTGKIRKFHDRENSKKWDYCIYC